MAVMFVVAEKRHGLAKKSRVDSKWQIREL
jgi:hypothetical protein